MTLEGRQGVWRVARVAYEEEVRAELVPWVSVTADDLVEDWRGGDGGIEVVGAPWMRVLDLPMLPGEEDDARPVVAVAGDPWWPMSVHGGADAGSLSLRAEVGQTAVVGELLEPLRGGPVDRWDEVNTIRLTLGGGTLESRTEGAVLDGANAVAIQSGDGWEIVQFCEAQRTGADDWVLSKLLRGRLGTRGEAERGASAGAAVVLLSRGMPRLEVDEGERGLSRLWRAGPKGLPPAGHRFGEIETVWRGRARMPWRPVHLRVTPEGADLRLSWVACVPSGDDWDNALAVPVRFRVRVLSGQAVVREIECDGPEWTYGDGDQQADFGTAGAQGATLAVAQWGERWGWGEEARVSVP